MKLALGTAQFGLKYGVANMAGRVPSDEAGRIVAEAARQGMDVLDTAIAYGDSESVLGEIGVSSWRVVTKLPMVPNDCDNVSEWAMKQVEGSLTRLRLPRLYAVLLHQPHQMLGPRGAELLEALQRIRVSNLADKVGLSVYSLDEFAPLLERGAIEIVQAPFNLLDRRLVRSGWGARLRRAGVELHARSVFLQGLLLMAKASMPKEASRWSQVWDEWERWRRETGSTPLTACVRYALSVPEIDRAIVGVDNVAQLKEICAVAEGEAPGCPNWPAAVDPSLIDPSLWGSE